MNQLYDTDMTHISDCFDNCSGRERKPEVGTGAEFMERANWNNRPYGNDARESSESQISFYKYSR